MSANLSLIDTNMVALEEGARLLTLLEKEQYTQAYKPAFKSTIGAHFRHLLEHYRCFLAQMKSGTFCYDKRERDQLLERDASYAARTIDELRSALIDIPAAAFLETYQFIDEQTTAPVGTSLHRELLFLQSHTVHHYAIIGAMTRAFGKQPEEEFGVAIATRTHDEKTAKNSSNGGPPPCAQ